MSGVDDDAVAETLAASGATLPERSSRSQLDRFVPGSAIGRYQLRSRLGAGAMGVVWSARDPQLDRDVAIKLVHPELASEESSSRLLREARAMAKLSHRAVITVHDAGEADGTLFLAMELVRGTTLGQLLRERADASDWRRWLAMMLEAGRGLADAHQHGVLHRDFKPDNVLVDGTGRVCVGDFGLAMLGEASAAEQSRRWEAARAVDLDRLELTTTGALLGTPAYMSPQQLRGQPIDARGDQFAFCVATWEALYGTRPFVVEERGIEAVAALLAAIERGVPEPPASTVPEAVREVLARGMSVDPSARWPDMDVLLVALDRAANRPKTVAPSPRRRRWPIAAALIGVLAIAGGAYWLTRGRGDQQVAYRRTERFSVPLRARIALSPDGSRLAVASSRLEVYDTADPKVPRTISLPNPSSEVDMIEVDAAEVRFSIAGKAEVYQWSYASGGGIDTVIANVGNGGWRGTTVAGELVQAFDRTVFSVTQGGREVNRWPMRNPVELFSTSPDKRQVAVLDQDRFGGAIVVFDVTRTRVLRSSPITEPTALAWIDDHTLLYATAGSRPGTAPTARLFRLPIHETGFGEPVEIYSTPTTGSFGRIDHRAGVIYAIEVRPEPAGHLVTRTQGATDVIAFERGAVPLGWTDQDASVTWNRESHRVARYGTAIQQTAIVLDAEPANATIAGDSLIVSVRRTGGRETLAVSLIDGVRRWRHDDLKTLAVRCAGDRRPPCFAIRTGDDDRVVQLDAFSGRFSQTPIATGKSRSIEDIAVSDDGTRILIAGMSKIVREVDRQGRPLREIDGRLSLVRTVAYDPAGGIIVGGTGTGPNVALGSVRTSYMLNAIDAAGNETRLAKEGDGILLLARAAPNKQRVSYVARLYEPLLVELAPE